MSFSRQISEDRLKNASKHPWSRGEPIGETGEFKQLFSPDKTQKFSVFFSNRYRVVGVPQVHAGHKGIRRDQV